MVLAAVVVKVLVLVVAGDVAKNAIIRVIPI
jgi:hypothetical protein